MEVRRWCEREMDILKEYYPVKGFEAVRDRIDRSRKAINSKAMKMGIKISEEIKAEISKVFLKKGVLTNKARNKGENITLNYRRKKGMIAKYPEKQKARTELLESSSNTFRRTESPEGCALLGK